MTQFVDINAAADPLMDAYRRLGGSLPARSIAPINATPFRWTDPASIAPRRWIYGHHYIRKFVSETVAPGGYGKSTLAITEALAIVTGRPLLGITPNERVNVWLWNGEDPMEELQRRIAAACLHYDIDPSELEGRLFVCEAASALSRPPPSPTAMAEPTPDDIDVDPRFQEMHRSCVAEDVGRPAHPRPIPVEIPATWTPEQEFELRPKPFLALLQNVRRLLLFSMRGLFLKVILWRSKKRQITEEEKRSPQLAISRSWISNNVTSGWRRMRPSR